MLVSYSCPYVSFAVYFKEVNSLRKKDIKINESPTIGKMQNTEHTEAVDVLCRERHLSSLEATSTNCRFVSDISDVRQSCSPPGTARLMENNR